MEGVVSMPPLFLYPAIPFHRFFDLEFLRSASLQAGPVRCFVQTNDVGEFLRVDWCFRREEMDSETVQSSLSTSLDPGTRDGTQKRPCPSMCGRVLRSHHNRWLVWTHFHRGRSMEMSTVDGSRERRHW